MKLKGSNLPDNMFIKSQLIRGTKVEKEHTNNKTLAKTIAKVHLAETGKKTKSGKISSKYYDELYKLEKRLRRKKK